MFAPLVHMSEAVHHLGHHPGQDPVHHLAHVGILTGAVLAFAVYALADIRRHGRPSFGWSIRPPE